MLPPSLSTSKTVETDVTATTAERTVPAAAAVTDITSEYAEPVETIEIVETNVIATTDETAPWLDPGLNRYGVGFAPAAAPAVVENSVLRPLLTEESVPWLMPGLAAYGIDSIALIANK
ncbi:hypothetical protein GGI13_008153 [Coemansia sp. RSA 455]|nr:hypothetical protein GGI13_008153 [Coemansia sp. RSA 455]